MAEACFLCDEEADPDRDYCPGCHRFICHGHPFATIVGRHMPEAHDDVDEDAEA